MPPPSSIGGRSGGRWKLTALEVFLPKEEKRVDVLVGRLVELDRDALVESHTQASGVAEIVETVVPAARSGDYPCVSAPAVFGSAPRLGDCTPPIPIATLEAGPVDRFDVDLQTGKFVLRQTVSQRPLPRWPGRLGAVGRPSRGGAAR
jgi:hypothetical protein